MLSPSPSRWHKPDRKSSTPFFPGAWPNNSTHSALVPSLEAREPDDIEAQLSGQAAARANARAKEGASESSIEFPNFDRVMAFHERLAHSFNHGRPRRTPAEKYTAAEAPMSSTLSESSQMTGLTEATSLTSPSDGLPTPSPSTSLLNPDHARNPYEHRMNKRFSLPRIVLQYRDTNDLQRSRHRSDVASHPSTAVYDMPPAPAPAPSSSSVPSSVPGLPPLSLPSHTLSFSPESVASYFSTSDQSSRLNTADPSQVASPISSSSSAPALSILSSSAPSEDYGIIQSPGAITSLQNLDREGPPREAHEASTPAPSSLIHDTDSPILPSHEAGSPDSGVLSPSRRTRHFHTTQTMAPSSTDMDAFGLAAAGSDARSASSASIPTSFRSAFFADSASQPGSRSMDDTARGHGRRQSSVSLSLSMSLSGGSFGSGSGQEGVAVLRREERGDAGCGGGAAVTYPPPVPYTNMRRSTAVSGTVHAAPDPEGSRESKMFSFKKVKRFGDRIKKMLKGKLTSGGPEDGVGVTTASAVTASEYESEHPISLPKDKHKSKSTTKIQTQRMYEEASNGRRQSMPARHSGSLRVSGPRPLRPNSFLVMDAPTSSQRKASRKMSAASSSSQRRYGGETMRSSSVQAFAREMRDERKEREPSNSGSAADTRPSPSIQGPRPRTRTAPQSSMAPTGGKSRRLSLSSPISKSRMNMLKATVIPHPPLPRQVTNAIREDLWRHSRAQGSCYKDVNGGTAVTAEVDFGDDVPGTSRKHEMYSLSVDRGVRPDEPVNLNGGSGIDKDALPETSGGLPEGIYSRNAINVHATPSTNPLAEVGNQSPGFDPSGSPVSQKRTRRSRGFSLSSAISSRAMKAKSMILGRIGGQDFAANEARSPYLSPTINIAANRISSGEALPRGSSVGCAEYEPDLVLDSISFAHTHASGLSGLASSAVSTNGDGVVRGVLMDGINVDLEGGTATRTGEDGDGDDETQMRTEEQEEERGFLRALGLEFAEVAKRTTPA